MIYVLDTGPLIDLFNHYYPDRFPSLWEKFESLVDSGHVVSVDEVLNEIQDRGDRLSKWAKDNKHIFHTPTAVELEFVTQIFSIPHFQSMIRNQERLKGKPVADPFVIAKAKQIDGCVVTREFHKPNAAQIPNVCNHFMIPWIDLEQFMANENWVF
ncbi:MAG: DUF4411 family protein [Candidatus Glassbacteria bacterium]|nr:DUF4411 family protein [Candidatus Glassbacteria bacterium]